VKGFRFSTDVRVRFAETDAQRIAHNATYLVWFEVARVAYLDEYTAGYRAFQDAGFEATVVETHVRYLTPAVFDDVIRIWTRCVDVRGARFRYEYLVTRGDELLADAHTLHAVVLRESYRPTRMPDWLVSALGSAESAS
jgi:acyl-CoA thioester hydrolase